MPPAPDGAGDRPPRSGDPSSPPLSSYVAAWLVGQKGYQPGHVPEAAEFAAQCDLTVTLSDNISLTTVGIVDAERHPDRRFALDAAVLSRIAEDCERNKWLSSDEMIEYGLADRILEHLPLKT